MLKRLAQSHVLTLVAVIWVGSALGEGVLAIGPGAIGGNRYRVIVSTDLGGSDADDIQSMVHCLLYSDLFDTEGLISSPPHKGRAEDIIKVIDVYAEDFVKLRAHSEKYPKPEYLRSITRQGAVEPAGEAGFAEPTEGSRWIIDCAKKKDRRPLYVLVWGSITDVAQALHDDPSIKENIRVHFIASWNLRNDLNAFAYIEAKHSDTWLIHNDTTFRGWYMGGEQGGDLGNKSFVATHIKGHGALGEYFAPLKGGAIKMGDTPTVSFLLRGTPDDPSADSWGGRFVKKKGRPNWWIDDGDAKLAEGDKSGARTVNKWRQDYLRHWQGRMDRCLDE